MTARGGPSAIRDSQRSDFEDAAIPTHFEDVARQFPDRPAVVSIAHELSYRALNDVANRIAHAILRQCGAPEEPLALLFEPGAPIICALLAGLKAGKICVPLDAALPRARLATILREAQAPLLITDAAHLLLAESLLAPTDAAPPVQLLNLDALPAGLPLTDPGLPLSAAPGERHLFHVRFDRRPKGRRPRSPRPTSPGGLLQPGASHRAGRPSGARGLARRRDVGSDPLRCSAQRRLPARVRSSPGGRAWAGRLAAPRRA